MKNRQFERAKQTLVDLEVALRTSLIKDLPGAADSGMDLFRLDWNPRKAHIEWLRETARQAIELRSKLMEEIPGSVGQLYLDCVNEALDCDNQHRRGPRRLARHLLDALMEP